ncbi:MAG: hypothetical protein ACREA0_04815, partial [bacterium]
GEINFHGKGFLVYGLPTAEADNGLELTNVAKVLPGHLNPANDRENGTQRQTDVSVISNDSFEVRLRTKPVRLLGSDELRDMNADGDEALLRMDAGRDLNGNGSVDFKTPGTTEYGFERFVTKHSPLIGNHDLQARRGDGEFRQRIDASRLEEGIHFLTARAYRHRDADSPAVFSAFKRVIYVDRLPPASVFDSFRPIAGAPHDKDVWIRSVDLTAGTIHVFANLPAATTEAQVLAMTSDGLGRLDRIDRALYKGALRNLPHGSNALTIVTFEPSGRHTITRVAAVSP